ncbi:MAG TPA: DUF6186 family protein [Actinomycetota bacterium]
MNSHDFTVAVFVAMALAGVVLEVLSRGQTSRIPSLGTVFSRVMRTRSGRVGVVAGWVWLGLHFFAR